MEFIISLGVGGWALLVLGSLLFGVAAQFIGETQTGYEWLVDAIGAGIGALVASEFIVAWQTFEPVWDGLAIGARAGRRPRRRHRRRCRDAGTRDPRDLHRSSQGHLSDVSRPAGSAGRSSHGWAVIRR